MARAADTSLANVRRIATNAALMWRNEGVNAEKREKRASAAQARLALTGLLVEPSASGSTPGDESFDNENPDRYIASL
ncbi:MAG TPA: hypothetical protein VF509_16105 [Sphingobium sp.]